MPIYKDKPEYEGSKSLDDILCYLEKRDVKSFTRNGRTLTITLFSGLSYNVTLPEGGSGGGCCYMAGEGIIFRNAADTQDKTTLAEAGLIKIKPATTTDKGGVKVYGSSNTNVTATTRPASPKTNRTYGLEIGNDDKAYVYVPWEKIKEINYTGTENGNTLISAELSSQDADGNVSLNIGRANRLVTVNSATGNGNTVTAVGEDSNHNVTVTTANRLVSVNNATGDGNAVTAIGEDSNHNITVTKGVTFVNTVRENGTGIVLTSIQQNGAIVTATKSTLSYNSLEDKPTIGSGKFKIQSNSSTAVNTLFNSNSTDDTVGIKFVNGGNITVTAAAASGTTAATLTMGVASGYSIPSDSKQSEWDAKSDTDTKNTAGTMNTNDKIYIVGAKTKATSAANDDKQTNTNGDCFIGTDHCLYSDNEKVAIQKDVNEINDLLNVLEQWPTITHTVNVKSGATVPSVTLSSLPDLTSKFTAQQNGAVSSIQITSNNQAVKAGSTVKSVTSIAVTDSATFTPSGNSITIIGKTTLSGFTNGYRTTLSGNITQTQSYVKSGTGTAQITKVNKSKTADSTLTLAYNNTDVTSVNNASANTNITIPTNVTVTSNLGKGLNTITLTYHNPSSVTRGDAEYTIPEASVYNVSSLNRSNAAHLETEAANSDGCPGASATAQDKVGTLNVYGVYPIFSTTGKNIITDEATAKSTYNTGSTIDVNTNKNYCYNYYTTSSIVLYFFFGSIPNGSANSNAKIFLPVNTDSDYNLRITEIKGFNAVAQNWTVPMTLTGPTEVSGIDGRTYKQYIISDSASAGQGPNAYRVTISR